MKRILIKSLLFLLLFSCGEKKNTSENEGEEKISLSYEELGEILKENESITAKLEGMVPITAKEMDSWMPTSISTLKRIDYKTNALPESFTFVTTATFKNSNKELFITILDGAGPMGSVAIGPLLDLKKIFPEFSDHTGFQKIINKDGKDFLQKYTKKENSFLIQFIIKDRYITKIKAKNLTEEELWEVINAFHFENLHGI